MWFKGIPDLRLILLEVAGLMRVPGGGAHSRKGILYGIELNFVYGESDGFAL